MPWRSVLTALCGGTTVALAAIAAKLGREAALVVLAAAPLLPRDGNQSMYPLLPASEPR